MLASEIIAYGRSMANIPSTNFFTDQDALWALNSSWKDIYSILTLEDDDYFVTQVSTSIGAMTPYPNRENTYTYTLPADFYRLRLVQYQSGDSFESAHKMNLTGFGTWQGTPAYMFRGTTLIICDEQSRNYEIWYYPKPQTWIATDDISYPYEMIPEVMAYQVAVEIERKGKQPPQTIQMMELRKQELLASLKKQVRRDDFNNFRVSNVHTVKGAWR